MADHGALRVDAGHQLVPGLDEGYGAFFLEPRCERVNIDARFGKTGQNRLAIAPVRSEPRADVAMLAEGREGAFRHGVDGEGRGESLDVEDVGGVRILSAGAGEDEALRPAAGVGDALEAC